ncbi:phage tail protein [Ancylobacter polymorphus]|uniref:Microcystin-dependent protein n=1 Tax=Ancylobacter polymorphus TaxID=223390 RepID=A0ABU0BJ65_9HYPH|nr:tail fiber protein [Ancylobacter polymorphus]MDQ0304509.1 microcystin-dependent protein [Ancylobacter polymorphus]
MILSCELDAAIGEIRLLNVPLIKSDSGGAGPEWVVSSPEGWLFCDGSILPINRYNALFASLGIRFGGDGRTTFALPDLRGRTPIGAGSNPRNLTSYPCGQAGGREVVALGIHDIPAHRHNVFAQTAPGKVKTGGSNQLAAAGTEIVPYNLYAPLNDKNREPLNKNTVIPNKTDVNGATHNNMQPFLALFYFICYEGIFF